MNKLETNHCMFLYVFIMYFYINVTIQFKNDKWNYLIFKLLNMHL